ncbi:MAG: recombinase family protein [Chloroflexi bacterium]|nr:recombinase family protein [Chloroflexota bacterium]
MKLALYTRVSTDTQDATNQVLELRAWADRMGHTIVAEYEDVASGARRREKLDDLFDAARRRKFELVAIWSLDRLTREGPLATLLYLQRLTAMGVRVYSHQEPYLDPSLPFYESIVAFLADIAKWERRRRSERTRAGLSRAVSQGKRLGRPPGRKDSRKRVVRARSWVGVSVPMG